MKIAWFSPRVPEHSDIANFTQRLEPELRRRFVARFFSEQEGGFQEADGKAFHHMGLNETPYEFLPYLNEVDVPIYHLGNNPTFFARTWFLSQLKPGIIVLHDLKLHHFFEGIWRERIHDKERYLAIMDEYYGAAGVEAGKLYWQLKVSIDYMADHYPMTAWGVRGALAVVVHTPYAQEVVQRESRLPVWLNALPYDAHVSQGRAPAASRLAEGRHRGRFSPERPARVVIFGYLNVNRRVIEFLHALAAMDDRRSFEVHIYGELHQTYDADVRRAADTLGLASQVKLYGYVAEEALDAGLAAGDLAINLRYPTMGEASGSQLRIWDHALPSIVTRIGGYATMPEDTVSFVRPDHEAEDLQLLLNQFLADPEPFRQQGERGRARLLKYHLPTTYVERLEGLTRQIDSLRSRHSRLHMATRVGQGFAAWSEAAPITAREQHYAHTIAEAF